MYVCMCSSNESLYSEVKCEDFGRAVQKLLVRIIDVVYDNSDTAFAGTLEKILYVLYVDTYTHTQKYNQGREREKERNGLL